MENSRLDNPPHQTDRIPGLQMVDDPDNDDGADDFGDQEERLQYPEGDQDALEPDGVGAGFHLGRHILLGKSRLYWNGILGSVRDAGLRMRCGDACGMGMR